MTSPAEHTEDEHTHYMRAQYTDSGRIYWVCAGCNLVRVFGA